MESLVAFAIAMTVLAASPGPGLAAVLSRSLSAGYRAGMWVVCGLVLVDFLFLGVAVVGLSAVAAALGPWFQVIKYLAAGYLIYVGVQIIRTAKDPDLSAPTPNRPRPMSNLMLGTLVTLGNPKAIFFYGALLPTFFDVSHLALTDYLGICVVIVVVSVVVYGAYMAMSNRLLRVATDRLLKKVQTGSGLTMIGAGVFVAARE